jgi:hypothetical protein
MNQLDVNSHCVIEDGGSLRLEEDRVSERGKRVQGTEVSADVHDECL